MKDQYKLQWKEYLVTISAAGALAVYILYYKGIFHMTAQVDIYRILCDAFFVPGILLTCLGVLVEIANSGFFYIFGYSTRLFFDHFTKKKKFRHEYDSYFDYTTTKRKMKKAPTSFVLKTGILFMGISAVFAVLFYGVYTG